MTRRDTVYSISPVVMPDESFGICKNYKQCGTDNVWLAWGMCVTCYDNRVDRYANKNVGVVRKGMPEEKLQ